jgi:plasmid maintenance system antidote protein VapI
MAIVTVPEAVDPLAMSPEDAARFLSISRRSLSDLIADETIIAKKLGARTLVSVESLRDYYKSLPKAVPGSIPNAPQLQRARS